MVLDFEKFSLSVSKKVICNLFQSSASFTILAIIICILSLWFLSSLTNCYFTVSQLFKCIFYVSNNEIKYCDQAPLILV